MGAGLGIGAGASVVGGIMQSIAASQAAKAMAQAFRNEIAAQEKYRGQAYAGTFEPTLQQRGVETAREQIGQGAQKRQDVYQSVGQVPFGVPSKLGPTNRTQASYSLLGKNRAQLGGYSDWALNQMISNIRAQDQLNKISNFASGTAQVFPYKMFEAQHSADELAAWGNLISSVGGSSQGWNQLFGQPPTQQRSPYGGYFNSSYPLNTGVDTPTQDFSGYA